MGGSPRGSQRRLILPPLLLHKSSNAIPSFKPTSRMTSFVTHKYRVNISVGAQEERMMLSGMHTVADIFCCCCGQIVGWKYEAAHDKSQKYKEGKFVLERGRIVDGIDSEFFLDNRPSGSDAED